MWASSVGAPPAGSFVMAKTTFSPFWATGSGANGLAGAPLQNRPPQALASPGRARTVARPASAPRVTKDRFLAFDMSRPFLVADDADAVVVRVGDVHVAVRRDVDA